MRSNYFKFNFLKINTLLLLVCFNVFAQQQKHNGVIRCHSTEYENHLKVKSSKRASVEEFENWLAPKIEAIQKNNGANKASSIITIPVVVHVIHDGDAYGVNENITDEQVRSQIQVMNEDYRRMAGTPGFNTNAVGADVGVEFCLAKTDPNGNLTNGIDRVNLGIASFDQNEVENNLKPNTIWNPDYYLNMWTCVFSGDLDGVLGYAQFPSNSGLSGLDVDGGAASTDGVIAAYNTFGSSSIYPAGNFSAPYDKGRTMTHEVGHWLGLRHIWGDGSNCNTNTDYCNDTPVAKAENYNCPTGKDSCPAKTGKDMIENYMDYTDDTCMNVFTADQKTRILAVLQNATRRKTLGASTKCAAPALGTDDFGVLNNLKIYPNPVKSELTILMPRGIELPERISIINSLGQIVYKNNKTFKSGDLKIDVSQLTNGVYFVKVEKENKQVTLKFIKN